MLALTPTPLESCPLLPKAPARGVFSMLRGKMNEPLSRLDHNVQTLCRRKLLNCLVTTASVQLENPVQKAEVGPPRAASKKGCGVILAGAVVMPVQAV